MSPPSSHDEVQGRRIRRRPHCGARAETCIARALYRRRHAKATRIIGEAAGDASNSHSCRRRGTEDNKLKLDHEQEKITDETQMRRVPLEHRWLSGDYMGISCVLPEMYRDVCDSTRGPAGKDVLTNPG
jgi:hypothetical protein